VLRKLRRYVETMRAYRNQPGGFWAASGDPTAADEAITGMVPVTSLHAAVLLSEGASRLVDRFQLATWSQLVKLVSSEDHQRSSTASARLSGPTRTGNGGHGASPATTPPPRTSLVIRQQTRNTRPSVDALQTSDPADHLTSDQRTDLLVMPMSGSRS